MIELVDFSNCKLSPRNLEYGGRAGEKKGIIYDNAFWFLKFPKSASGMKDVDGLSYVTSPLSEFIGSHIYKLLGYDVQETLLGICFDGTEYKVVCACKDFIRDDKNELLIPYTALRNDADPEVMKKNRSKSQSASNIKEIIFQLDNNTVLKNIPGSKERFWDVVVIDMLLNNNDRNEDNWGVIKNKLDGSYRLAPIYDCGNSFNAKSTDEKLMKILNYEDRLENSALNGITAYDGFNDVRLSNIELLKLENADFTHALERVVGKVTALEWEIIEFINSIPETFNGVPIMSKIRKEFYIETFRIRLEKQLVRYCQDKKVSN